MKKKNTMFKIIAIMIVIVALLSWIIPTSTDEITRVSLYDIFLYPTTLIPQDAGLMRQILFILAVGGFYGVLSKTGKYRNALEKIAKSMKGKEELFLIGTSVVLAILTSVLGFSPLLLLVIIPALCTIITLMGYDKITALLVTFLAPLIGIIGNTYGGTVAVYLNQAFSLTFKTALVYKIALFVLSYVIYIYFTITYAKKHKGKNNKNEENENAEEIPFIGDKKQSKKPSWPIFLILGLVFLLSILGHTDWTNSFGVNFFTDLHQNIMEWKVFDHTIISYLLNDLGAFGTWYFAETTIFLILASIIISLVYNLKDEGLKAFGEGVVKLLKPVALFLLVYTIFAISVLHPYFTTIINWFMDLIKNVTGPIGDILFIIFASISTILSSIVNIDFGYVLQTTSQITTDAKDVLGLITQSMYGITSFIAPTSIMLLLGIEYLNVSYKEWIKSSWKFILGLLALALVILILVTFI